MYCLCLLSTTMAGLSPREFMAPKPKIFTLCSLQKEKKKVASPWFQAVVLKLHHVSELPLDCSEQIIGPNPKGSWFNKSGMGPKFTFLTISPAIPMLLVQGLHFESHWLRESPEYVAWICLLHWNRKDFSHDSVVNVNFAVRTLHSNA